MALDTDDLIGLDSTRPRYNDCREKEAYRYQPNAYAFAMYSCEKSSHE
jgi:hypothetical protein